MPSENVFAFWSVHLPVSNRTGTHSPLPSPLFCTPLISAGCPSLPKAGVRKERVRSSASAAAGNVGKSSMRGANKIARRCIPSETNRSSFTSRGAVLFFARYVAHPVLGEGSGQAPESESRCSLWSHVVLRTAEVCSIGHWPLRASPGAIYMDCSFWVS